MKRLSLKPAARFLSKKNNLRIAVLDEDPAIKLKIKKGLGREAFDITHVLPGKNLLKKLASIRPDLIISEVFIGDHNIFEIIDALNQRQELKTVPIILFSSLYFEALAFEKICNEDEKRKLKRISLFLYKSDDLPILIPNIKTILRREKTTVLQKVVPKSPPALLLVDDDKDHRIILKGLFEPIQYHCLEAADGNAAMALFKKHDPALVLLDVMMPDTDGIETLKFIRKQSGYCPVIMMTAYSDENRAIQCLKAGADDYITKPYQADQLIKTVSRFLKFSEAEKARLRLKKRLQKTSLNLFKSVLETQRTKKCLLKTQERLIRSEKIAAITKITVSLHHEIRNPLSILSGNLQLWRGNPQNFSPDNSEITSMIKATQRIKQVLDKLSHLTDPVETTYAGITKMIDVKKSRSLNAPPSETDS